MFLKWIGIKAVSVKAILLIATIFYNITFSGSQRVKQINIKKQPHIKYVQIRLREDNFAKITQ